MKKHNVQREDIERIYGEISPFELKDYLIQLANQEKGEKNARTLLDAGRGNPNWTAKTPRQAFFTFGHFAISEASSRWDQEDLSGMPVKNGIYERFLTYIDINKNLPGSTLLKEMIDYGIYTKGFDPDSWVYELTDGIIGDNYPSPDRMLQHIELVVRDYLFQELHYNKSGNNDFQIFGVEGATAAMCYLFDSLIANELLQRGDKIALMVPIFTPYLEIPLLPRYEFEVVYIEANELTDDGTHTWQYPKEELEKIVDPSVKALFIVNPGNPSSVAIKPETIKQLISIVKEKSPDLMIISDDVYGTFVDNFSSIVGDLPYNTIGVYSYSKYFGVTGWRLGTIALHEDNIYNELINRLPKNKLELVNKRYESISTEPENISFIDRIVADSRQVALNHTAGLSTPQQVQMAFFSLFALLDQDNSYKNLTKSICRRRKKLLFDSLGLDMSKIPYDAAYYVEFNLLEWATHNFSEEFGQFLQENYKPVDILIRLAEIYSIVLLNGGSFHSSNWSIRISLANLNDEDYARIGKYLHEVLDTYVSEWKKGF